MKGIAPDITIVAQFSMEFVALWSVLLIFYSFRQSLARKQTQMKAVAFSVKVWSHNRFASDSTRTQRQQQKNSKQKPPKIWQQSIKIKTMKKSRPNCTTQLMLTAWSNGCTFQDECTAWHFYVSPRVDEKKSKAATLKMAKQMSNNKLAAVVRVNENKWYALFFGTFFQANKNIYLRKLRVVECVCVRWTPMNSIRAHMNIIHISSPVAKTATHFWIAFIFIFVWICWILRCHLFALFASLRFTFIFYSAFISLVPLQVKKISFLFCVCVCSFGFKAFLWPVVCCYFSSSSSYVHERVCFAFANLFVIFQCSHSHSHTWWGHHRQPTNAHCYRIAGHHSYRAEEWELQLKVHAAKKN